MINQIIDYIQTSVVHNPGGWTLKSLGKQPLSNNPPNLFYFIWGKAANFLSSPSDSNVHPELKAPNTVLAKISERPEKKQMSDTMLKENLEDRPISGYSNCILGSKANKRCRI